MTVISSAVLLLQAKNYSGSGNWLDESGNSHDATAVGSPSWDGTKFTLNGTSDAFTVADHADLNFALGDSLTLLVWAKVTDPSSANFQLLAGKDGTNFKLYKLQFSTTGVLSFNVDSSPGASAANAPSVSNNQVGFFSGRRDTSGDTCVAGVDSSFGTPVTDNTASTLSNTTPFSIGYRQRTSTFWFAGDIYAVVLWRSALSDADLATAITELQATPATFTPRVMVF